MKLKENNFISQIKTLSKYNKKKFPEWREGQSIFNSAFSLFPTSTNRLRATEFDCFYDDTKIKEFLIKLEEIIDESK